MGEGDNASTTTVHSARDALQARLCGPIARASASTTAAIQATAAPFKTLSPFFGVGTPEAVHSTAQKWSGETQTCLPNEGAPYGAHSWAQRLYGTIRGRWGAPQRIKTAQSLHVRISPKVASTWRLKVALMQRPTVAS